MALPDNMTRIQISLDRDLLERIQSRCDEEHMTKSNFFALAAETALASADTLPTLFADAFVRSAFRAEIRSQLRELIEAQRQVEDAQRVLGLA